MERLRRDGGCAKLLLGFVLMSAPFFIYGFLLVQPADAMECEDLKRAGIIPDVLPAEACEALRIQVSIQFGSRTPTKGSAVPLREAEHCPSIRLSQGPAPGQHAFVFLTDPDAPSRGNPVAGEWAHWVASTEMLQIDSGSKTYLEYAPPSPPKGSGPHRYVALVYVGSKAMLTGIPSTSHRRQWGGLKHAHAAATENGLELVGVEWFTAELK
ncbi:phosphatidylethanolamine-binding protein [Besnoitia besnoiti]|uniref:Phosphatidylethanolamine-binding protein n=1 Tax=Besnoitia besnoiti TaxID=94643 RepID=A0A2A9M791_BESBE|nr:phosphatidylethanolamine-binding protein [Besnoitia besnoiti]PFH31766.1 phosphatidylethanolamine-binding protein [Besnoitia besnoiti]